ncbi:hypothetical protein AB4305_17180 [Nocardia sp. 2YAB30]|uniref:hypothetical protein n=1 Tax=unclassified Nocardia TaxID=2637762 RepID=UPI003F9C4104
MIDLPWLREDEDGPAAWMQDHDGTWFAVDDYGIPYGPLNVVDGKAAPVDPNGAP